MALPQLIYTDNSQYNERLRVHSLYLDEMNDILSDYNALGLAALTTGAEFVSLVQSPIDLVFDKMTGGAPVTIGGNPINRADAMKILTKPAGYDTLIEMIDAFKRHHPHWLNIIGDKDIVNGAVVVSQSVKDAELEACRIYLKNNDELALYNFAQDVIAAGIARFGDGKHDLGFLALRTIATQVQGNAKTYALKPEGFPNFKNADY